jgi:hypothetical protein
VSCILVGYYIDDDIADGLSYLDNSNEDYILGSEGRIPSNYGKRGAAYQLECIRLPNYTK